MRRFSPSVLWLSGLGLALSACAERPGNEPGRRTLPEGEAGAHQHAAPSRTEIQGQQPAETFGSAAGRTFKGQKTGELEAVPYPHSRETDVTEEYLLDDTPYDEPYEQH